VRNPEWRTSDRDRSGRAHFVTAEAGDAEPVIDADNVRSVFLPESERLGGTYLDTGAAADTFFRMEDGAQADDGTRECPESVGNRDEPPSELAAVG